MDGVEVDTTALAGMSSTLREQAECLQRGNLEPALFDVCGAPASHPDVGTALRAYGEHAHDQFRDVVALLHALSKRTGHAATTYTRADRLASANIDYAIAQTSLKTLDGR